MIARIAAIVCLALGLTGASDPAPSRATLVAELLDTAIATDDARSPRKNLRRKLAQTLDRLDRTGAHPIAGSMDAVAAWRATNRLPPADAWRGRVLGPGYRSGAVAPGADLMLEQLFLGGKPASLALATSNQPIRMSVTAPDGSSICEGKLACNWTPRFTERYRVYIRTLGTKSAGFFLVVD